jgi:predicted anti-sigma-YlaC factor YlaD
MTIAELEQAPMTCQQLVELVTDYLEGALSPDDERRFDEHIRICVGCRRYLDQMRLTIATLGRLTPEDVSPEAEQELIEVFRNWARR